MYPGTWGISAMRIVPINFRGHYLNRVYRHDDCMYFVFSFRDLIAIIMAQFEVTYIPLLQSVHARALGKGVVLRNYLKDCFSLKIFILMPFNLVAH